MTRTLAVAVIVALVIASSAPPVRAAAAQDQSAPRSPSGLSYRVFMLTTTGPFIDCWSFSADGDFTSTFGFGSWAGGTLWYAEAMQFDVSFLQAFGATPGTGTILSALGFLTFVFGGSFEFWAIGFVDPFCSI
jgi:hypothetical protein